MTRINNFLWLKRTKSKPFKYLSSAVHEDGEKRNSAENCYRKGHNKFS